MTGTLESFVKAVNACVEAGKRNSLPIKTLENIALKKEEALMAEKYEEIIQATQYQLDKEFSCKYFAVVSFKEYTGKNTYLSDNKTVRKQDMVMNIHNFAFVAESTGMSSFSLSVPELQVRRVAKSNILDINLLNNLELGKTYVISGYANYGRRQTYGTDNAGNQVLIDKEFENGEFKHDFNLIIQTWVDNNTVSILNDSDSQGVTQKQDEKFVPAVSPEDGLED